MALTVAMQARARARRSGSSRALRRLALACSAAAALIADLAPVALIVGLSAPGAWLLAVG